MKKTDGGLSSVKGYSFSAIECGIRYENRTDFCMIYSEKPCNASGVFTTNRVFAAPVKLGRERISNEIRGIIINSTNANACTGDEGYAHALALVTETEKLTSSAPGSFLMSSTGVIGRQLPAEKMIKALPKLVEERSSANGSRIPRAIMTTDTRPKESSYEFETSIGSFVIAGTAKGSGMIAPNMATMLAYIITDASVSKDQLNDIFKRVADKTFNALTIDGDMSTNDTAIILSPKTGKTISSSGDLEAFEEAVYAVCSDLSRLLIQDAEGGTKCVAVNVVGAKSIDDARLCARAIAQSLLVKTAFFGGDPNWGRIACAAGYSGADFAMEDIGVSIEGIVLLEKGQPAASDMRMLAEVMKRPEYSITVTIGNGSGTFSFLTSDISYDYVKINAEYST